jgi:hypothetical protein
MEIAIFNVVAFAPTDDGKFRIVVHHVAGTNSEDAQRRILKMPPSTCRDVASSALTRERTFSGACNPALQHWMARVCR